MKAIELFSGAGGIGLSLKNCGYETILAIDSFKDAVITYNNNIDNVSYCSKIEDFPFPVIDDIDLITAGFPCQPFSTAGLGKGFQDKRTEFYNNLFEIFEWYSPKFIMLENVKRFATHDNGNSLKTVIEDLEKLGYTVKWKVLNANDYNVPQKRERIIIIANNIGVDFSFPPKNVKKPFIGEWIKECSRSEGYKWSEKKSKIFALVPEGGNWNDLPTEEMKKFAMGNIYTGKGGRTGFFKRMKMDEASGTLTTTPVSKMTPKCHPIENRPISVQESQRIQTFPYDYQFHGSISSQYKQIGNAVPVNLSNVLVNRIKNYLLGYM